MTNAFHGTLLSTESDVEQKIVYKLLTLDIPLGLGYSESEIRTKVDIRKIKIDKGLKGKLYYPDYAVIVNGLPLIIIEAKTPNSDITEAMREARLYATEINASYPRNINPCELVIATDGLTLSAGFWDKEEPELTISIENFDPLNTDFSHLIDIASRKKSLKKSNSILSSIKSSANYVKPIQMLGGKVTANETVGENSFGANVSIEYKYLFNPETLADRASIAQNAYVTSIRKQSHVAPIDKIIRAALPTSSQAKLIEDTNTPKEIIDQLSNFNRIKNEICLLIGGVGSGKSTFTDFIRLGKL